MPNPQNLIVPPKGTTPNPNGRPKGIPNRKTILNYLLFEADIDQLGVVQEGRKPAWWDKVKPKNLYEAMTLAMAIKAMTGEEAAFNALNRALGEYQITEEQLNVVHIFKPAKAISDDDFDELGDDLRERTRKAVEAEVLNDPVESAAGSADDSLASS